MPNRYDGLYAWMIAAFGDREFTIDDFRATFPSPAAAKVLSDLRRLGYAEASRRGAYRLIAPEARVRAVVDSERRVFNLVDRAGLPYAYCDATAVTVWTDGGYWTGSTPGFRPIHIRVGRADRVRWLRFFRGHGALAAVEGSRETLFGIVHVLHLVGSVRSVEHEGTRVVPAREVLAWAQARPYVYEPALPLLRKAVLRASRGRSTSRRNAPAARTKPSDRKGKPRVSR